MTRLKLRVKIHFKNLQCENARNTLTECINDSEYEPNEHNIIVYTSVIQVNRRVSRGATK